MKIIELVNRHPTLFENLLAKASGSIGELLVAEALTERGFSVTHRNNNSKQSDLLVTSPSGTSFSVEVKCGNQRRPTWFVRVCPNPDISQFWFFIAAPRKPDELPKVEDCDVFILTVSEAQDLWMSSKWNKNNPNNGDIRRHQIPNNAKDAWHKIPN